MRQYRIIQCFSIKEEQYIIDYLGLKDIQPLGDHNIVYNLETGQRGTYDYYKWELNINIYSCEEFRHFKELDSLDSQNFDLVFIKNDSNIRKLHLPRSFYWDNREIVTHGLLRFHGYKTSMIHGNYIGALVLEDAHQVLYKFIY